MTGLEKLVEGLEKKPGFTVPLAPSGVMAIWREDTLKKARSLLSAEKATGTAKDEVLRERIAQITAHRACCGSEHDIPNGKIHGYCVVCGVPWPCDYAGVPPSRHAADEPLAIDKRTALALIEYETTRARAVLDGMESENRGRERQGSAHAWPESCFAEVTDELEQKTKEARAYLNGLKDKEKI